MYCIAQQFGYRCFIQMKLLNQSQFFLGLMFEGPDKSLVGLARSKSLVCSTHNMTGRRAVLMKQDKLSVRRSGGEVQNMIYFIVKCISWLPAEINTRQCKTIQLKTVTIGLIILKNHRIMKLEGAFAAIKSHPLLNGGIQTDGSNIRYSSENGISKRSQTSHKGQIDGY